MEKQPAANDTKRHMRIILIRNAYSFDVGGAEKFPVMVAEELRKNNIHPIVVSRHAGVLGLAKQNKIDACKGWWWAQQNWSGVNILGFPVYFLWQLLLTFWYLQLFLRLRPDVIHAQSRDDFIAATIAGRLLGKRIIWTDHADLKYVFANHKTWYKNPAGKLVFMASKLADKIVVVSKGEWALIEQGLGSTLDKRRFALIYNGVLDKTVVPVTRSKELKESIIFSCTSRLVTTKGIGELIAAFKIVHTKYPKTHLWLVGDGPEAESFKLQAKSMPSIDFLGYSESALSYVAASDIFVHPSYNEAFSLSLIEATKLGKPLIACNVGGNPEIVHDGQNGILIPEKSIESLAEAMIELAGNDKSRAEYGLESRKYYEEMFVFETIVKDQYIPLYEK